jgi:hypothetical protein
MAYPEPRAHWGRTFLIIAVLFVASMLVAGLAGCDDKQSKFDRDCKVRGGHVQTHKQGDSTSKVCLPPAGGWQ